MVGRGAGELGGAGVHGLERRPHAQHLTARAHGELVGSREVRDLRVGQPHALEQAERVGIELVQRHAAQVLLHAHDVGHARDEEGVHAARRARALDRPAAAQRLGQVEDALGRGTRHEVFQRLVGRVGLAAFAVGSQARAPVLQRAHGLAERFLERSADGHDLADGLHARGQRVVGALELLEREARHLHHAVVDGRLEAGGRGLRDVVHDLVERVAHGQLRGRLRDGEARGLRRERRGARHAGVHLYDDHAAVFRVDGELHVGAAGLHADLLEDGQRRRAHALVLHVRQRLRGRHRDGVARVHAHGVEVLDGAHDDAVAGAVAHDLHLVLCPALDALQKVTWSPASAATISQLGRISRCRRLRRSA